MAKTVMAIQNKNGTVVRRETEDGTPMIKSNEPLLGIDTQEFSDGIYVYRFDSVKHRNDVWKLDSMLRVHCHEMARVRRERNDFMQQAGDYRKVIVDHGIINEKKVKMVDSARERT